jgi:hypothetical protein
MGRTANRASDSIRSDLGMKNRLIDDQGRDIYGGMEENPPDLPARFFFFSLSLEPFSRIGNDLYQLQPQETLIIEFLPPRPPFVWLRINYMHFNLLLYSF